MTPRETPDSFGALATLEAGGKAYRYFRLAALRERGLPDPARLPYSLRVLLEAALRAEDGRQVTAEDVAGLAGWRPEAPGEREAPFLPARVLLQDFTGVPAVVDLAAMRSACGRLGGDPRRINPLIPVDLVVDHSIQVDAYGTPQALERNEDLEFQRNRERYELLRWAQGAFADFRVVPPGSGICHQVNLEHLAGVVVHRRVAGLDLLFPDSLVGTDSHTPMVNGLGVLGWGVGGIEAEAVMLGQPLHLLPPAVVGVRLAGRLPAGATATDLVLTMTELLRRHGVVEKFVEFGGPGLSSLSVPDRATLANMAPEYGATVGFFPVDGQTLRYLERTGRDPEQVALVAAYCRAQGLFRTEDAPEPLYSELLALDLGTVRPSLAGPKRPQDRIALDRMAAAWPEALAAPPAARGFGVAPAARGARARVVLADGREGEIGHGAVVLAAITSCTNTSNPSVMVAAGLLARKAVERGLAVPPWVKTSLAPGSTVVTEYLRATGLMPFLERLGFHVVGYGCTTCIGNSGPLPPAVARAVEEHDLVVAAVLSGNRNFEGRINPHVKANFLASPPLVVAFALAGRVDLDLAREPLGADGDGRPVRLADLWPAPEEVAALLAAAEDPAVYRARYRGIEASNPRWNALPAPAGELYLWSEASDYVHEPPFFLDLPPAAPPLAAIRGARVLLWLGDSVTTDHISPAGAIARFSPAGEYLVARGVRPEEFNSYGARRGDDRVMTRGTFANIRLRNRLAGGKEGWWTAHLPGGEIVAVFEAARRYREAGVPTIVLAGQDYGMGSSRDWAAKGTRLLGVRAVLAESYERIHRSNLVGMGVLPLQFLAGETAEGLGLTGREVFHLAAGEGLRPRQEVAVEAVREDGTRLAFAVRCRLDTPVELDHYRQGGILQAVLRRFLAADGGR